jgi:hypothetical protein
MSPRLPLPLRPAVPLVLAWVRHEVRQGAQQARPVDSFGFPRLGRYFSAQTLARARAVVGRPLPVGPFGGLGLSRLQERVANGTAGITLLDTFFVIPERAGDESLFFHELVHVVQWDHLGPEAFVEAYGHGLITQGYARCPLEVMAYAHEARFHRGARPYDVEAEIRAGLTPPPIPPPRGRGWGRGHRPPRPGSAGG